jgi:hypothetical protein
VYAEFFWIFLNVRLRIRARSSRSESILSINHSNNEGIGWTILTARYWENDQFICINSRLLMFHCRTMPGDRFSAHKQSSPLVPCERNLIVFRDYRHAVARNDDITFSHMSIAWAVLIVPHSTDIHARRDKVGWMNHMPLVNVLSILITWWLTFPSHNRQSLHQHSDWNLFLE